MSVKKNIARATAVILAFSLLGKVLGFVREMIIAAYFGTSYRTDAYFIGLTGPDFVREIISGGVLSAVFIPVYTASLAQNDHQSAKKFLNSIATLLIIALLLSIVVGIPLSPFLVRLIAPELDAQTFTVAVRITQIIFPSILFMGLASFYGSLLNVYKHFAMPSLAQLVLNAGIIIGVIVLGSRFGIESLAIGLLAGAFLQFAVIIPSLWSREIGFRPEFEWSEDMKRMFSLWVPLFIASFVGTANDLVSRSLAAGLESGNIAALNFANRIRETIWLLCAVPLGTAVFPFLSSHAANNETKELESITSFAIRLTTFMAMPLCFIMLFFSKPIIQVLFERGMFNEHSTMITASALTFYSIGALFYALNYVVLRVYYSVHNVFTPLKIFVAGFIVNVVSGILLRKFLLVGGITLARSLSDAFTFAFLLFGIAAIMPRETMRKLSLYMLKTSLIALVSILFSYLLYLALPRTSNTLLHLIQLGGAWTVASLCYLAVSYWSGISEVNSLLGVVKKKLKLS